MLKIYIIHPKLCPNYIIQLCTDTINRQNSLLMYIHSYEFYYILRFIFFLRILLARTIHISSISFTQIHSYLYYVIPNNMRNMIFIGTYK